LSQYPSVRIFSSPGSWTGRIRNWFRALRVNQAYFNRWKHGQLF
jgi:hypothetical protein